MDRRNFLKHLGLGSVILSGTRIANPLGLFSAVNPENSAGHGKTNVILINVDDLGWTDLSCYGSRFYETPHIDGLAAQGMKFTDAYAACAVCSPTRAAIMTGRYPARTGITDWIHHLDREAHTAVGTGKNPVEYVATQGRPLLCPPNPYWMELDEVTIAEILKPAGYATGHIGKWHLGHRWWYPDKQGFDKNVGGCEIGQPPTYFDPYYQNENRSSIPTLPPRKQGEYLSDREADEAVLFIEENRDRSFFLHMCPYAVHTPLEGKPEVVAKFENKTPTNQSNAVYAAMVESVDGTVGKIMKALDELDLAGNTLVIFTSDNGGLLDHSTDNAPLRSGKGYPYEGGIRVPLIVRWLGKIAPGSECSVPVTSVDFFPTVGETAGVSPPPDRAIDGKSLMPLLLQQGPLDRDAIYWHFPHYRGDVVPYSIVRKERWKLIKRYEGKTYELFDLEQDIGEKEDLADKMPDKVKELDALLKAWLERTGAKLPRERSGRASRP